MRMVPLPSTRTFSRDRLARLRMRMSKTSPGPMRYCSATFSNGFAILGFGICVEADIVFVLVAVGDSSGFCAVAATDNKRRAGSTDVNHLEGRESFCILNNS